MKEIWKKHKLSIITSAFLALMLVVVFFAILPLISGIREKSDDIQKKILDNQINREKVGKISQLAETDKVIREKVGEIDVVLNRDDEVEFIKKLESLADQTGNKMTLSVDESKASSPKSKPAEGKKNEKKSIIESLSYDSYTNIQIRLEGNYASLVSFMNKLENFRYYVNIISLESKKSAEITEKKVAAETPAPGDIFSVPNSATAQKSAAQETISKKEKDILTSTINIIVYTKK